MENKEKTLAKGLYFKHKHENAPDWVIGKISIKIADFSSFVKEHKDGEYLNFEVLESKEGKPYIILDTWKPDKDKQVSDNKFDADPLPF